MFFYLWWYNHIHGANRHLLDLCLHYFLGRRLLLDPATEPKNELTEVFFLRREHFEDTILLLLVPSEQCTHTFFVGFPPHLRVEMADDIFAFVDRVDSPYEEGEKGGGGVFGELQAFVEEVLIHVNLVRVHVDQAHPANLETLGYRGFLQEERDRVILL